jgi:hypothetical protein
MRIGDMVHVFGIKGGPFKIVDTVVAIIDDEPIPLVRLKGLIDLYPATKCYGESKSGLEGGRLFYVWDLEDEKYKRAYDGCIIINPKQKHEPVNKRWGELSEIQKDWFIMNLYEWEDGKLGAEEVLKTAYKLITRKEHP